MTTHNATLLSCIEIEASIKAKSSIIWLHGLGADANDFIPLISELNLPADLGIRFIFPHAPMIPITINNGYVMRAWYDIHGFSHHSKIDHEGIGRSQGQIAALIENEIARGVPANKIFLGGFSQGAVVALVSGLSFHSQLAGIIALSGYLPFLPHELVVKQYPPVFLAHGTDDIVVPYEFGEMAKHLLTEKKLPLTSKSYPIGHSVSPEEIIDLKNWLMNVLK